ncbi:fungal-specific transcription factor domain-containing protein [Aspergillus californicus]
MTRGISRPYRSRLVRPCDACRRRRIACIRAQEDKDCSLCRHRGKTCTFDDAPQMRRRPRAREAPVTSTVVAGSETHPVSPEALLGSGTTMFPNRTCLYTGASGDQDPDVLRHLVYDDIGRFGHDSWTVWRVSIADGLPSYFTIYPNSHLDGHPGMYSLEKVESVFVPYEDELTRLYYTHFHPSYPILESQEGFQARRARREVPGSLLAMIYYHGAQFWRLSPLAGTDTPPVQEILPWIFSCLTMEARTPNLSLVQALLLYMQMIPSQIRAPNHPGFWPLTSTLVGIAQDVGLHVDPANWNIAPSERKMRRIMWWAVLMHDKWMSHLLGRPSHIIHRSWNVEVLTLTDFSDDQDRVSVEEISSSQAFISLCSLTMVLSEVSDSFYTIRSKFEIIPVEEQRSQAEALLLQVQYWMDHIPLLTTNSPTHSYTTRLLALTVALSIKRAVFSKLTAQHNTHESSGIATSIIDIVRHALFPVLESLEGANSTGMWLSYSRGGLTMTGSLLMTLLLSSVGDEDFQERRALLIEYRSFLKRLNELHAQTGHFEVARLPLRRLNLIMEQLFGTGDSETPGSTAISDDMGVDVI